MLYYEISDIVYYCTKIILLLNDNKLDSITDETVLRFSWPITLTVFASMRCFALFVWLFVFHYGNREFHEQSFCMKASQTFSKFSINIKRENVT